LRAIVRLAGPDPTSAFGSALIGLGLILLLYAAGMYVGVLPGSRVTIPRPPALDRARPVELAPAVPVEPSDAAPIVLVSRGVARPPQAVDDMPLPIVGREGIVGLPGPAGFATAMRPADADERPYRGDRPPPGQAVRLRVPSIKLETDVVPAGVVSNKDGEAEWETVPFVAAHYVATALVGARGNAIVSGHVVTLREGNVFRNLYQVDFGDRIDVDTEAGTFTYIVEDLRLVPPTAVEVLAATSEPTLTLVTCGGEFDQRTRTFSDRLIVIGKLADWSRHRSA